MFGTKFDRKVVGETGVNYSHHFKMGLWVGCGFFFSRLLTFFFLYKLLDSVFRRLSRVLEN